MEMRGNKTVIKAIWGNWVAVAFLLGMGCTMQLEAQRYRKVMQEADLTPGASYLLAAQSEDGAYRVVKKAEVASKKEERRLSCIVMEKANGELEVNGSEAAVFVLEKASMVNGRRRWYLKDEALQAYLCYNPEKITSTKYKACYTLPLEEVKGDLSREFWFDFEHPAAFLATARQISYTLAVKKPYYIRMSDTSPFVFRLYPESAGLALKLYKQVEEPQLEVDVHRGLTFKGEWTGDSLCSVNMAEALSIDFTNATLPLDWAERGVLPAGEALVYVLQEHVALLPKNKKNMVVLDKPSCGLVHGETAGLLFSPIAWSDNAFGEVKYAFRIPAQGIFGLTRSFVGDGEWESGTLPFAFIVPKGWEVSTFRSIGPQGVAFDRRTPGDTILANEACLMRYKENKQGPFEYTFQAIAQVVPVAKNGWQETTETTGAGFYGVNTVWQIPAATTAVYVLNSTGTNFVRALPGSWLSAWKAFLYLPQEKGEIKIYHVLDGVRQIEENKTGKTAVYSLDGVLLYSGNATKALLQQLPQGIYILHENGKSRLWKK